MQVPEGEPKSREFGKGCYILVVFFFEMVGRFCSGNVLLELIPAVLAGGPE